MRLLFDQNVSPRLAERLEDVFPDSAHVSECDLGESNDYEVWGYARKNGYAIVSKDSDFSELVISRGQPPKVIWIRRGNCSTDDIESILRKHQSTITDVGADSSIGLLELS